MTDTVDTSKEAVRYIGAETLVPDDEPRQIVCTGEAGGDVWNPAFGEWECDEFGMDSDDPIGKSERLFVNRRLYDALLAERDQLRREVEEAREHKHHFEDCVVDLSEAGYLCFVKHKDGLIGEYDDGDRVFLDVETGKIDAHGLYILSNSAWEGYKTGERDAALDEAAYFARSAWLFPPDGVDRYDSDAAMCDTISKRILALKARPSPTQQNPPTSHQ